MIKLPNIHPEEVLDEICAFTRKFVDKHNSTGCVIGLSGGIDSSVTAAILSKALEDTKYNLVGYMLPLVPLGLIYKGGEDEDVDDAIDLCKIYNIEYRIISISSAARQIGYDIHTTDYNIGHYHMGNMFSRVRAVYLNTLGAIENKVVAGTGNNDEDDAIGYYTLFGDGAVHFSPIGGLSKRLVYEMATYLHVQWGFPDQIIEKTPTAGLEPGQTDEGDLGYSYDVVEIIKEGVKQKYKVEEIRQYLENSSLSFNRNKFSDWSAVLLDYGQRNYVAQRKQLLLKPEVAPITLRYI